MTNSTFPLTPNPRPPPLKVPLQIGMPVIAIDDGTAGNIAGTTQACCIYRLEHLHELSVAPWREIALGNIRPDSQQLPADPSANDRANAGARVLAELLALRQFGLTPLQTAALEELTSQLCGSAVVE